MNGTKTPSEKPYLDVIIIGAGISGINTAQRIKTKCPSESFIVFEDRGAIGGTWELFNYPGLRSDSDLYTFGFAWKPWDGELIIASKDLILNYMKKAVAEADLEKHIQFHSRVVAAHWSSSERLWTVTVQEGPDKRLKQYTCKFMVYGSGLYDYAAGKQAPIDGIDQFKGEVYHPQFWPESANWAGKDIAIIGSGATAVTVLPVIAEKAKSVTMIQRSPGYVIPLDNKDGPWTRFLKFVFPLKVSNAILRWQWIMLGYALFFMCRTRPMTIRNWMLGEIKKNLPKGYPMNPNFDPAYMPGDQRICFAPNADFHKAISCGKASVITGKIKTVTEKSVRMESGEEVPVDMIITATGLKILFGAGIDIRVDGKPYDMAGKFLWRGALLDGLPNAALVFGYTNASYTLGADATAHLICRMLDLLRTKNASTVIPRLDPSTKFAQTSAIIPLKSSYVREAMNLMPRAGDHGPWKARSNYFADMTINKYGGLEEDLEIVPK